MNSFLLDPRAKIPLLSLFFLKLIANFRYFNNTSTEMTNYSSICSDINFITMCTNYYRVACLKIAPAKAWNWKINVYVPVSTVTCA